jgi:cation transport regulator ChaB
MPREDTTEMPSTIQPSDKHAQEIWEKAHDSAVQTCGEGGRAHRVAYAALKHEYEKKGSSAMGCQSIVGHRVPARSGAPLLLLITDVSSAAPHGLDARTPSGRRHPVAS